jgi:cytochrome c-type biogenesis protein CcmF
MTPGDLAIKVAAALAVIAFVAALRWARGHKPSEEMFRWSYHGLTAALSLASFFLLLALLTHDFRYDYVIGHTSRDLPLLYIISAFWGGQEGTYLLWAWFAALVGYFLFRKNSWEPAAVMAVYVPTIGFLLSLMLQSGGNPFRLSPVVPPDGRGLNPLLQDPWMASHPPAVFIGYVAMTVPAVLALVALFKHEEKGWVGPALKWALVSFVTLGAGIILGGFWAYKVLGWGGYWGWDPVENASLVPWIVVTALLHGLLIQRASGALRRTNLVLALAGFLLVYYATFLTRSGVLANFSVHSFPAGSVYWDLVGIMTIILGVSLFALAMRRGPTDEPVATHFGWPLVLTLVLGLFAASATFVLVGTSWPILSTWFGTPSTPGAPFYNQVNLPLYVVLLALLSVGPFLGWLAQPARAWLRRLAAPMVVAAAATATAYAFGGRGFSSLLLFFVAFAALTANVIRFASVVRTNWLHTGAAIAHIGFAMMFVGIVASSGWERKTQVNLPIGQPVEALDRIFTYRGHVSGSQPKDQWRVAVLEDGKPETTALVWMYVTGYDAQGNPSVMRKPSILRRATYDLYVAPLGLEVGDRGEHLHVDLVRGQPQTWRGITFTFVRFVTGSAAGGQDGHSMDVAAVVELSKDDAVETVTLPLVFRDGRVQGVPQTVETLPDHTVALKQLSVEQGMVRLDLDSKPKGGGPSETLIVEVSTHPLMYPLWAGTILLGVGCGVALWRRVAEARALASAPAPSGARVTLGQPPAQPVMALPTGGTLPGAPPRKNK